MYRKPFINKYLEFGFEFDEARSEVDFALDILFNYSYKDFMLGKALLDWQITKLWHVIKERVTTRRPMQQIVGQAYFCSKKFFVNEHTLIPRPETEILVDETIKIAKNIENINILDIGTGTGCIPISISLACPNAIIESVDISNEALKTAKKNALLHNVHDKINFYNSNLFENIEKNYDIIVSNPPYIPLKDKDTLEVEVKNFDPYNALFTNDEDGIEFYEKIIITGKDFLLHDGYILFELGINQAQKVADIFEKYNFKILKIVKDLNEIERVIIAKKW